jgi:hypothetical protein
MSWPHKRRQDLLRLALLILQQNQWKPSWVAEFYGKHYMQTPGGAATVRIYTRNSQLKPQFRYGIRRDFFASTDFSIFFAKGEPYVLAVPSQVLLGAYNAMRSPKEIDETTERWVVNIYFDEGGKSLLKPVRWRESIDGAFPDLTDFRISVS